MPYRCNAGGTSHVFADLRTLLARASPDRAGDRLARLAAASDEERVAARIVLADLPLTQFLDDPLVPYEADEVTRLIIDTHDSDTFAPIAAMTTGEFRDFLLSDEATRETLAALAPGITPEMAAGVSKLMRNQDLIAVAKKISVVTRFRTTIGLPGRLCTRIQPNHPTDDLAGIGASILDGLMYGCGDACIGINLLRIVPNRPWRYSSGSRSCGNGSKYRSNLVCSPTLRQLCRSWSKVGRSILFFNP